MKDRIKRLKEASQNMQMLEFGNHIEYSLEFGESIYQNIDWIIQKLEALEEVREYCEEHLNAAKNCSEQVRAIQSRCIPTQEAVYRSILSIINKGDIQDERKEDE